MEDHDDAAIVPVRTIVQAAEARGTAHARKSEVYCSNIIQRRANNVKRFVHSPVFLRIIKHCHPDCKGPGPDGSYPRPTSSPFPCYGCHRRFTGPPVFLPLALLDGHWTEWGNFCSGPCGNTYLRRNMNDANYASRAADFFTYLQDVHGFRGTYIGFAPGFDEHVAYGGDLDDEKFDIVIRNCNLNTIERMAPFYPTDVVIEWTFWLGSPDALPDKPPPNAPPQQAVIDTGLEEDGGDVVVGGCGGSGSGRGAECAGAGGPANVLEKVLPPRAVQATHHKQWDIRHLRQPPLEEIEKRLAALPPQQKREGLYERYLNRKGGFEEDEGDNDDEGKSAAKAKESDGGKSKPKAKSATKRPAKRTSAGRKKQRVSSGGEEDDDGPEGEPRVTGGLGRMTRTVRTTRSKK